MKDATEDALDVLDKHGKPPGRFVETLDGTEASVIWQEDDWRMVASPNRIRGSYRSGELAGSVTVFLEGRRIDGLGQESWSRKHLTDLTETVGLWAFAKAACKRLLTGGPLA